MVGYNNHNGHPCKWYVACSITPRFLQPVLTNYLSSGHGCTRTSACISPAMTWPMLFFLPSARPYESYDTHNKPKGLLWSPLIHIASPCIHCSHLFSAPSLYRTPTLTLHTDHCRSYIHFTCCDIPTFTSLFHCVRHADYAPLCDDTTWSFSSFFIWSFSFILFLCVSCFPVIRVFGSA